MPRLDDATGSFQSHTTRLAFRRLGLVVIMALFGMVLAACAGRGTILLYPDCAEVGSVQRLLVATVREPEKGPVVLSGRRAPQASYFDFSVSVPPEREPGTVRFPQGDRPNPETDFTTVSASRLGDSRAFQGAINRMIAEGASPQNEVVIFVHGFNVNFAEGLYRQAQLVQDFQSETISVNFSWASAASVWSYAFDRESALIARDALEQVITAVQATRAERIVIIAHSMGAHLTMETLRQMAIRNNPNGFSKLASIVLVAPDLDVQLFANQSAGMSARDIPIYVFVSSRDRALRFSTVLRGQQTTRLGLVTDNRDFGELPVAIIDTSSFEGNGDPLQHFKAATSPTMIAMLSGTGTAGLAAFAEASADPGVLQGGVEAIQDAFSGGRR
jgi:esterase/lipase superfamily enzyme